jgi:hypothetical protein
MARNNAEFSSGHGKSSPLETIIPAPKKGEFLSSNDRGPRPELPHKTDMGAGGDYSPINLSDTQKLENKHIKKQQDNWDKHDNLETQAKTAATSTKFSTGFNEEEMEPEARARLEKDSAEMSTGARQGLGLASIKEIHGALQVHLDSITPHVTAQHETAREVRREAVGAYNKATEMDLSQRAVRNNGGVVHPDDVEEKHSLQQKADSLQTFSKRHMTSLNQHATAQSYLNKSQSLMKVGRTADATDLLVAAHKHIQSMSKHLTSPLVKAAYDATDKYIPSPDHEGIKSIGNMLQSNIGAEGGGVGRKRGPQGDAPKINIGKPGRLKGDVGSQEAVTADEEGLKAVTAKYGTQHPYTKKVKQAHVAWKQGKQGNKSVRQIALGPVNPPEERDNAAVLAALRSGDPFKSPEVRKQEFIMHANRVSTALISGRSIPAESADHIGKENVGKLMVRHLKPKEN